MNMEKLIQEVSAMETTELLALNRVIVERIRMRRAVANYEKMATLKLRVGAKVKFRPGPGSGYTVGVVQKVNRVKVKVKIVEGAGKIFPGSIWNVPINMLEAA